MLHMKLNSAVSTFAVAAAFAVFLPPSNASAGVCFLPDCMDDEVVQGDINMNINSDTEYCEKEGYTYYSSGECPQYQAKVGTCSRDEHYLKCDAVKWCKNNGYNTQTCSLPSFVNGQCPNGKPYYKGCKEDRPRACREQGYVNSCSPGRLYATSNRCPWDSSYGKCCTASPSAGCPTDYKVTCDPSRGSSGRDTCGYTCYRCCDDTCPSGTSKNYTGSYATTTECGSRCNRCKSCPSGSSTSYTGSYAGTTECNGGQSCYRCNDTCRSGQKSVSCSSTYKRVKVSTTECGTGCYQCQYNTDCSVTSKSCSYGCASYNSCSRCTRCNSNPPHSHSYSCPSGYSTSCSNGYSSTSYKRCSCGVQSSTKCYKCNSAPATPSCSGITPYVVNGKCSECRTDNDCVNNTYPGTSKTYATRGLPWRYFFRCNTRLGKCVEGLSVNDCKTTIDSKVGGGSKYKFKDSSTAYVGTSGGCNCFYYLGVMPSGRLIRCHGSHSSGYSCAVKSCSSDSDCSGYTMDGRATYCGQASSEAGNKKWCVPKVNVKENSCTIR